MGTVVGSWRLNLMILLFVFLSSIYISYLFLGNIGTPNPHSEYIMYNDSIDKVTYNNSTLGLQKSNDFLGVFGTLINLITFGSIDNVYARLFLNIVMSIIWITIGYIVYTYVKEWVPLT